MHDLTTKIEPVHKEALRTVARAAATVGADWFLTGALARYWIFELIHGMAGQRATHDADIAIAVGNWEEFERIREGIMADGEFIAHRGKLHQLDHKRISSFHIDIIPFGALGGDRARITWPPEHAIEMNLIGFQEAYYAALIVLADADLPVKIASVPGLMLTKLFAWADRKHLHNKDAADIRLLLSNYEKVAASPLHDIDGLMALEDFVPDHAAARLLGRDVAKILTPCCRGSLLELLDRELPPDGQCLLAERMAMTNNFGGGISYSDERYKQVHSLLVRFRAGLDDHNSYAASG